jgi:ribosomal protein S14/DNA-directed RNA polymerase subunit RPC12/RpoP
MTGWLLTLLVPSVMWALGHALPGPADRRLPLVAYPVAGFLAPAALVRWCGRPFPEQVAAWVVSLIAWAGAFVIHDGQVFAAFGILGAAWGLALGARALRPAPPEPAPPPAVVRQQSDRHEQAADQGFALELRCPTCGAAVALPIYHRMTRCHFCGSEHVVAGLRDTLVVVIPDSLASADAVKAAVVKHLRHRRYLTLYDQRVRPLVPETGWAQDEDPQELVRLGSEATSALANAVEAEVVHAADAYAARIAPRVSLEAWRRFLSPYWHRFGTLYQAAFGRDAEGVKRMEFTVVPVEASVSATPAPLPAMGKLSYLRALRPLQGAPEAGLPALPVEYGAGEIDRRAQQLERRSSELVVRPIAVHATLVPEVVALVYRPWHLATVELDGERLDLLLDGGAGAVEGNAPPPGFEPVPLPEADTEAPTLTPSRCPECGGELPFEPDAVAHLCRTCFRLVAMTATGWTATRYLHEEPRPGWWQVPFWRFPLRLRTTAGDVVTDLAHLTDGIDGTFDQIGARPQAEQRFFVPAFRTRVGKTGVRLYRRLWPLVQGSPRDLSGERFSLARPPERVVDVTLGVAEARAFARVYLALAFTQRDLARAQVRTVRERFLSARLEGDPDLVFLGVPEQVIGPFVAVLGRARPAVVAGLEGRPPEPAGVPGS